MRKKWDCFVHNGVRHVFKEKLENFQKLISVNPVVYCFQLSFSIMCGTIDKLCGRLPTCSLWLCRDQGTIEEEKKNGNLARLPAWQQGNPA